MIRKPDIQYVGQFYIHGSEARQLELQEEKKQAKTRLPLVRIQKISCIYLDPVAIFGILVAAVMLITMVSGTIAIQDAWEDYRIMESYLSELKRENAQLLDDYRGGYDLEEIRATALAMGMIPREEVQTRTITVTIPQPEPEMTWQEEILWFLEGLFA